jgi:hypothetical protein
MTLLTNTTEDCVSPTSLPLPLVLPCPNIIPVRVYLYEFAFLGSDTEA